MTPLRLLDLFSGIGGFSLGLERSGGFRTVAFCEINSFTRQVLAKHWPEVPCYEDVRTLTAARLHGDGIGVDAICGGFPCQDISDAGKRIGIEGERSGLWSEYARLVRELRPKLIVVENVAALLSRGLGRVLGDLASLGYDAEWECIPASALGAPHRRDRLWIVAYPSGSVSARLPWREAKAISIARCSGQYVADAQRQRRQQVVEPVSFREEEQGSTDPIEHSRIPSGWGWWASEPKVGRVADGVPTRVDRLAGLGNAVVPQIPEMIGRAYLASCGYAP